jgi:hypothetical protein
MDDEIVFKLGRTISASPLNEPAVQHILVLARKLTERVPALQIHKYPLLKFYCDWTLHSKIDRSEAGGQVLAQLHKIIADEIEQPGDLGKFTQSLSAAMSLGQVRADLNEIVRQFGGPHETVTMKRWPEMARTIAEIISNVPLGLDGGGSKLRAIAQGIQSSPIRGGSNVTSLAIVRNAQLEPASQDPNMPFWLEVRTIGPIGKINFRAPLRFG